MSDEELPQPGGPLPPVIPAPKRPAPPAAEAGAPEAAAPDAVAPEAAAPDEALIIPPVTPALDSIAVTSEEIPVPEEVLEEAEQAAEPIVPDWVPAPEPVLAAEVPEPEPAAAPEEPVAAPEEPAAAPEEPAGDASLEEMVAGLREEDAAQGATIAEGTEAAEGAEGAEAVATAEAAAPEEQAAGAAPEPAEGEPVVEAEAEEDTRALARRSAKLPFWIYIGLWLVFAGVQTYLMWPFATEPFVDQPVYGILVLVATGLVCSGLILGLGVWWFVSAHSEPQDRSGLVRAMLVRTSAAMAAGVVIWWVALLVLDLRRAGMLG